MSTRSVERSTSDDPRVKFWKNLHASLEYAEDSYEKSRAEVETLREHQMEILLTLYATDSLACANLCDDLLDRSGALLGRVRNEALRRKQESK